MSRPVLAVLVVVVLLAALLWALPRNEPGPEGEVTGPAEPRPASAPTLRGAGAANAEPSPPGHAPETEAAPEPARGVLRGVVRTRDGWPLAQPRVYLLPKIYGGDFKVDVSTRVDDDGRWVLEGQDPTGHWIGARTRHHRPAFFDGDLWTGEAVELVVEPGRVVAVTVRRPSGRVPVGVLVRATPPPRAGAFPFPGPGRRLSFDLSEPLLAKPKLEIVLPTDGPVLLRPQVPGHIVVPRERVLQLETREAAFEVVPACVLKVEVEDAETEREVADGLRLVLMDLVTGRQVFAVDSTHALDRWMNEHGLAPGNYALLVERAGYQRYARTNLRFERPGQRLEMDVSLVVDPSAGRLLLHLDLPEAYSLENRLVQILGTTVDTRTGRPTPWRRFHARYRDAEGREVEVGPLEPGDWTFLVWAGASRVGRVEAVVGGGSPDRATVSPVPGLVAELARWRGTSGSRDDDEWTVRLEAEDLTPLPVVRFESRQTHRIGLGGGPMREGRISVGPLVEPTAVLGPYPVALLRVYRMGDDPPRPWIVRAE